MAARCKTWVYCSSLTGIASSNPPWGMDVCPLCFVVCCELEISATGRSLVQRSPTECVVPERDRESSQRVGPGPQEAIAP